MKKVIIIATEAKGISCEVIRGEHKFAPNATVTGIIPVGTKTASQEEQAAAAAAYASQLNQYTDEEFDILNGKTVWGGYIIRTVLSKKLKSLGFEVLTQPQTKIDRWGEGKPHGYEKYFKGGYAAQIICGSLEESGLVSRDSSDLENMFQINCAIRNKTGALLGTGYLYLHAGSRNAGKKVAEIFFSEHYGTDIEVSTKTELVEHPGIWVIKDTETARKAVAAAKKNNGILYTKAAVAELQEQRKLDIMKAELAVRDERIAALEATVAKLQATVATLLNAPKPPDKPEDDPEDPPPPPETTSAEAEDEDDWGDLDDISTPGYHEDSMMNPNAKQETPVVAPKSEEPLFHKEENVEEQDAPKPEINTDDIVLTEETVSVIASFLAFNDIAAPCKAVIDYEAALQQFETERDQRYKLLMAHAHALGCTLEELKDAVKKFRPQGLKINGITIKDSKMYVLANKCGPGLAWYEITTDNGQVKILKDSFLKLTNGVK